MPEPMVNHYDRIRLRAALAGHDGTTCGGPGCCALCRFIRAEPRPRFDAENVRDVLKDLGLTASRAITEQDLERLRRAFIS
jgi:hypothetical protein